MMRKMTPVERLLYGTCRIEARYESGAVGVGTAFYYARNLGDGRALPMIITNRHVIWDANHGAAIGGKFQVHTAASTPDGKAFPAGVFHHVDFVSADFPFHSFWRGHANPDVDLCAMPAASLIYVMKALNSAPFLTAIDDSFVLSLEELGELNVVEDVIMVGYPTGLWDEAHNLPLFRKGSTATHPAIDFQGRPEFVVDLACFPGSSGSPVFSLRSAPYPGDQQGESSDPRRLLGVLHSGPTHRGSMVNLGYVLKAHLIQEVCDQAWAHWASAGYFPIPWNRTYDTALLPPGSLPPEDNHASISSEQALDTGDTQLHSLGEDALEVGLTSASS